MNIICKPCFSIDAVEALARNKYCRDDIPEMWECVESVTHDLEIINSDWGLNDALFRKMDWSLPDIEKMTLGDLRAVLPDAMNINEAILPSKHNVEIALDRLIESDYVKLWNELCLPRLEKHCAGIMGVLDAVDIEAVISDINKTKDDKIGDVVAYISYFMEGGIGLASGVSVQSCSFAGKDFIMLMLHELTHGFIHEEVTELYKYICETDEFQKRTRWYLSNRWGSSGSEEEFVIAMTHYIAMKNGVETLEEAKKNISDSDHTPPLAVILFYELLKMNAVPDDYNAWLVGHLREITERGDVQKQVDELCPGYSKEFEEYLSEYEKAKERNYDGES